MPQQKDIFDSAPSILDIQRMAPAPQAPPAWQQDFEHTFPAAAAAAHQMGQIPQGLMQMGAAFSPLRFREGWDRPTLEIPEAARAFVHPLDTLSGMFEGMVRQPIGTVAQEAGALIAPNTFQAPTQEEMDRATQGATQLGATLIAPKAIKEGGEGIQAAATRKGIPQALARAGTAADEASPYLPKWAQHPLQTAVGPVLRAAGRKLYDVTKDPKAQVEKVGTYIPPEGPTPPPTDQPIDVTSKPVRKKLGAPEGPKQLPAPAPTQPLFYGQEGGLPPQTHPDVVGQQRMPVRAYKGDGTGIKPGAFRLETVKEMKARLQNFGRTVSAQPGPEAQPYTPPRPPRQTAAPTPPPGQ